MFINFGFEDLVQKYVFEIKTGNNIQRQIVQAPTDIIKQQFIGLMQEISQAQQPIRVRIIKEDNIYDEFKKENKVIENYLQFANKIYMSAFENEFKD